MPARILAGAFLLLASPVYAQNTARAYQPAGRMPVDATSELVIVFICHSASPANEDGRLAAAIRQAKSQLASRFRTAQRAFSAIGVAMDATVETGIAYLVDGKSAFGTAEFGLWDEVHAGHGWLNSSVVRFVLRDFPSLPAASTQLLILERSLSITEGEVKIGNDRVLARFVGQDAILAWVERGLPLAAVR